MTYKKKVLVKIPRQIQADWNQTDETKKDFIKNKPIIPDVSLSAAVDTNEDGTVSDDYLDGDIFIYDNKYYVAIINGNEGDIVVNPTKFTPALNSIDAAYISLVRKMNALHATQNTEQNNEQNT